MAEVARNSRGKLDFVRQALRADPDADAASIDRAWRDAGHEGTIGPASVGKVRGEMGSSRGPSGPAPAREEGTPVARPIPKREPIRPIAEDRRRVLRELEDGLDGLLFRATGLGDVPEVEEALRAVRRLVVLAGLPFRPRVAVVGASADRAKFGNKAVRAFARAGFEVYPINPNADRVEGLRAYASLDDLPVDRLDRVSLYVPSAVALRVLDQLASKRVGEVWLNPGADAPEVVERARALGFEVVQACSILAVGEHPERL